MSAQAILDRHINALGDTEETLKDYDDNSVVIAPAGTLRGVDEIRPVFTKTYESLFKPGTYEMTIKRTEVHGDVAYMVWEFKGEHVHFKLGTDTFVIRNGKVAV